MPTGTFEKSIFAQRLQQMREKSGYKQKDFAQKINIRPSTYNGYESGSHEPNSDVLTLIATELSCSIDYLLGLSDFEEEQPEKNKSKAEMYIPSEEHRLLLINFDRLNRDGKQRLFEYLDMMILSRKFLI